MPAGECSAITMKRLFRMAGKFLVIIFCLLTGGYAFGQQEKSFVRKNLAYYYYPGAEIRLDYHVAWAAQRYVVYFRATTLEGIELRNNYLLTYELRKDYQAEEAEFRDTISYSDVIYRNKNQFVFRLRAEASSGIGMMLIRFENLHNRREYLFDIPLKNDFIMPYSGIIVRKDGLPHFRPFVNERDTFALSFADTASTGEAYCYYYQTDFKPASPPMSQQPAKVQENLRIDSLFALPVDEKIRFDKQGLYLIQEDTTSVEGISLLATDRFFPRVVEIEDVIEPLIYISTRAEREKLSSADNKKAALDRFWLNLSGNAQSAKNLIKQYYQRVREANAYFTNYKEGWKTDMGMIYILFGPPDEVYRDEEKEEWRYDKIYDIPPLSFSFVKIKNIFAQNHYSLIRSADYERHWYRIVDMWRKGRFSGLEAN